MKKKSLFKILAITMVVVALLTWFIPAGYYQGEYVASGINRLGILDLCQYLVLPFFQSMFLEILVFLLAVGIFYGVLSKTGVYKTTLEKIAKKFKKKGTLFLIVTAAILTVLSSVGGYGLLFFAFIPLLISIILLMGYDRVTALLVTIGSILVGIMGATFATPYIESVLSTLNLTYVSQIYFKIALLVLSFAVLMIFVLKRVKTKEKSEKYEDKFLGTETSKGKATGLYVVFAVLFVLTIMGCTNWSEAFGITIFTKFHEWLMSISIKDFAVFANILGGSTVAIGTWSYFQIAIVLVVASLVVAKIYKVRLCEGIVEGIKKIIEPSLLAIFAYGVLILIVNSGMFVTLMSYVLKSLTKFNALATLVSLVINIVGSFTHIELTYVANFYLPYLAGTFTSSTAAAALNVMTQAIYGLTMFVAPTSLLLVLGLTYLEIPYNEWLKKTWKLVISLLILVIIIIIALLLIL